MEYKIIFILKVVLISCWCQRILGQFGLGSDGDISPSEDQYISLSNGHIVMNCSMTSSYHSSTGLNSTYMYWKVVDLYGTMQDEILEGYIIDERTIGLLRENVRKSMSGDYRCYVNETVIKGKQKQLASTTVSVDGVEPVTDIFCVSHDFKDMFCTYCPDPKPDDTYWKLSYRIDQFSERYFECPHYVDDKQCTCRWHWSDGTSYSRYSYYTIVIETIRQHAQCLNLNIDGGNTRNVVQCSAYNYFTIKLSYNIDKTYNDCPSIDLDLENCQCDFGYIRSFSTYKMNFTVYSVDGNNVTYAPPSPVLEVIADHSIVKPLPVVELQVEAKSSSSLSVSFKPDGVANIAFMIYAISYSSKWGDHHVIEGSRKEVLLTGLKPYTNYSIAVRCKTMQAKNITEYWSNWTNGSQLTLSTAPSVGPPLSSGGFLGLTCSRETDCPNLRVFWTELAEIDRNGPMVGYIVEYIEGGDNESISLEQYSADLEVDFSRNSTINVYAITKGDDAMFYSPPSTLYIMEQSTWLEHPTNIIAETTRNNAGITFSWKYEGTADVFSLLRCTPIPGQAKEVLCQSAPQTFEINSTLRSYFIPGYNGEERYAMSVTSGVHSSGLTTQWIPVCRYDAEPGKPEFTLSAEEERSLLLKWDQVTCELDTARGQVVKYTIFWTDGITNGTVEIEANLTSYAFVIPNLVPHTNYDVSMVAIGKAGEGEPHKERETTLESAPDDPPQGIYVSNISVHEVTITFQEPTNPNGVILYYLIAPKGGLTEDNVTVEAGGLSTITYVLTDLDGDTNYTVYVYAVNSAGTSESSDPVEAKTLIGAPSKISSVSTETINVTIIRTSWSVPVPPNGEIDSYHIIYARDNNTDDVQPIVVGPQVKKYDRNFNDMCSEVNEQLEIQTYVYAVTRDKAGNKFSGSWSEPKTNTICEVTGPLPMAIIAVVSCVVVLIIIIGVSYCGYRYVKWKNGGPKPDTGPIIEDNPNLYKDLEKEKGDTDYCNLYYESEDKMITEDAIEDYPGQYTGVNMINERAVVRNMSTSSSGIDVAYNNNITPKGSPAVSSSGRGSDYEDNNDSDRVDYGDNTQSTENSGISDFYAKAVTNTGNFDVCDGDMGLMIEPPSIFDGPGMNDTTSFHGENFRLPFQSDHTMPNSVVLSVDINDDHGTLDNQFLTGDINYTSEVMSTLNSAVNDSNSQKAEELSSGSSCGSTSYATGVKEDDFEGSGGKIMGSAHLTSGSSYTNSSAVMDGSSDIDHYNMVTLKCGLHAGHSSENRNCETDAEEETLFTTAPVIEMKGFDNTISVEPVMEHARLNSGNSEQFGSSNVSKESTSSNVASYSKIGLNNGSFSKDDDIAVVHTLNKPHIADILPCSSAENPDACLSSDSSEKSLHQDTSHSSSVANYSQLAVEQGVIQKDPSNVVDMGSTDIPMSSVPNSSFSSECSEPDDYLPLEKMTPRFDEMDSGASVTSFMSSAVLTSGNNHIPVFDTNDSNQTEPSSVASYSTLGINNGCTDLKDSNEIHNTGNPYLNHTSTSDGNGNFVSPPELQSEILQEGNPLTDSVPVETYNSNYDSSGNSPYHTQFDGINGNIDQQYHRTQGYSLTENIGDNSSTDHNSNTNSNTNEPTAALPPLIIDPKHLKADILNENF